MGARGLPAGLTRRGKTYVVQYRDAGVWRRQAVGDDLEAALEQHHQLRSQAPPDRSRRRSRRSSGAASGAKSRAAAPREEPRTLTFRALLDRWLADQRIRTKANTLRCSIDRGERLASVLGPKKAVASLTSDDVARFVQGRRRAGSTDVTINGHLRILRAMLNWAVSEQLLERSPVRVRMLRTLDRKRLEVFTPEEIEEVLDHASPKIRLLVMIIGASGMRREEALHLQWADVDFGSGRIDIRGKRYPYRQRDGSMVQRIWTPKTYEERSVYVTPDVLRALDRFRQDQRRNGPGDWIFQSDKRRGQRWTNPTKPLQQAFQDAGIYEPGKLLHAIRHTVGTRLLRATDLETARAQLGHRNIATTMQYLHTDEERRRQAGHAIGLLGGRSRG